MWIAFSPEVSQRRLVMMPHNGFGPPAHLSASFTYRTTEGFQTSRSIRKSATLGAQPVQLSHIIGRKPLRAFTFSTILSHPVAQHARVDPEISGHLGDRHAWYPE